jgi:predicted enzyme related to lactoylglutathione lyase
MGCYQDFCLHPPGEPQPVAGICHARGHIVDLPPVWLVYITVDDLDQSIRRPNGRFCVVEDPAGAVCALFQPAKG